MFTLSLSNTIPSYLPFSFPSSASPEDFSQSLVFYISFILLTSSFHVFSPFLSDSQLSKDKNEKKLSWIITSIASFVMTVQSIPFLYDYFSSGGSVVNVRTAPTLAVAANRFFQAYLVADLTIGSLYYRSQINLLTGWVHHIVYVCIVEYAIRQGWANVFSLCASMEFPTFVLGIAILYPRLRSNVFFAVSFFLTRILLHVILGVSYYIPSNRPLPRDVALTDSPVGSLGPAVLLTTVFPLHASWFHGCIKGFIRRAKEGKAKKAAEVAATSSGTIKLEIYSEPSPTLSPTLTQTAISSAVSSSQSSSSIAEPRPAKLFKMPTLVAVPVPAQTAVQLPALHLALATRLPYVLRRPYAHYYTRYTQYRTRFRALRAEYSARYVPEKVRDSYRGVKEQVKGVREGARRARQAVRERREGQDMWGMGAMAREAVYECVGLGRRSRSPSPAASS